uniref:Putative regulator of chromosome condensation n=1 Tax=Trypanosoma vivax (strain Y486) TaxID=1055687 RepID=G0TXR8_TRYVY|nr:putative regulator of chromosome condensation [Trypanosoma vivax Y486]
MQGLIERFVRGDKSVLPQILSTVESQASASVGQWDDQLYQHLVRMLVAEGRRGDSGSSRRQAQEKESCLHAICILITAVGRGGPISSLARHALAEAGVGGCRTMNLDRYFSAPQPVLTSVVRFAAVLAKLLRVRASEFLTVQENIEAVENEELNRPSSRRHSSVGTVTSEGGHFIRSVASRSNSFAMGGSYHGGGASTGDGFGSAVGNSRRTSNASNASMRRPVTLPQTASFVPLDQNPLFMEDCTTQSWLQPQFPTPALLFAKQFGEACVSNLPPMTTHVVTTEKPAEEIPVETKQMDFGSSTNLRRIHDARVFEHQCDPLFSRYLSDGVVLMWGNVSAIKGPTSSPAGSSRDGVAERSFALSHVKLFTPVPVVTIRCGSFSCYFLTLDNGVYSCGNNDFGQLGIGVRSKSDPTAGSNEKDSRSGLHRVYFPSDDKVCRLEAGSSFAIALTTGGKSMYVWGQNAVGQCLSSTSSIVKAPELIDVSDRGGTIMSGACGQSFAALVFSCGSICTWGSLKMLGVTISPEGIRDVDAPDDYKCSKSFNVFKPISERIVALRAGEWHCLAITSRGSVYSWGVDHCGRLGLGEVGYVEKMRRIEALDGHFIVNASCGNYHSVVLTREGDIFAFGENKCGQLGLPTASPRLFPGHVFLPKPAVALSCGREHTCLLLEDGDVMVCGSLQSSGMELGYGNRFTIPRRTMQSYIALSLASGEMHGMATCLMRSVSVLATHNPNPFPRKDNRCPMDEIVAQHGVRMVSGGKGFTVLLTENNQAYAAGQAGMGQLGLGSVTAEHVSSFAEISLPKEDGVVTVSCGHNFVIAISTLGTVYSWGSNSHGQLGLGDAVPVGECASSPQEIEAFNSTKQIVQVACGGTFAIALSLDGKVYSWGEARYCSRGSAEKNCFPMPEVVSSLENIICVASGAEHAVALSSNNVLHAWGRGPLGDGGAASDFAASPVVVTFAPPIRQIGCGEFNTFAITNIGDLFVWGSNENGQCGVPQRSPASTFAASSDAKTDGEEEAAHQDTSAVLFPTLVSDSVRDAAFCSSCGVLVKEDGTSAVCGRLKKDGEEVLYTTFVLQVLKDPSVQGQESSSSTGTKGVDCLKNYVSRCFRCHDSLFTTLEYRRPSVSAVRGARGNMVMCLGFDREKEEGGSKTMVSFREVQKSRGSVVEHNFPASVLKNKKK